jgi:hypothetical protein
LDVIGNKDASYDNYRYLRDNGLDAIPTVHYGCDPKELDRYAADGVDFIGLGGMVGRKSEVQRLLRWTISIFKYARDNYPEMRFHGWGITHNQLVMNLPWFSVDSSGFSSSYRFARLALFDSEKGKNIGIDLNGKDVYNHADLLLREYNCDPSDVASSTSETRRQLVRLSMASVQHQEDFLRKRHKVTPPSYGLNDLGGIAPNVHIASAAGHYLKEASPSMHVALGFPTAQSTISLNPDDVAPQIVEDGINIHSVMDTKQSHNSLAKNFGPSIHCVDGAVQHLAMVTPKDKEQE